PGGRNMRRPDRACIVYANMIRRHFRNTAPIVLGGVEASLRRVAHYDFRDDAVRRSVLFDAKADILVYGMGERAVLELADRLKKGEDWRGMRGICYIAGSAPPGFVSLPPYETAARDKREFIRMSELFFCNNDPAAVKGMSQKHGDRFLVHNRPALPLSSHELDRVHELPFELDVHPYYKKMGRVKALDTVRFSITTHRGCFGGCNFCSIAAHQGAGIVSRSEESVVREARRMTAHASFGGTIADVGGPTANMYGMSCKKMARRGACPDRRCLAPRPCASMQISHRRATGLLRRIRKVPGVNHAFVASGIRHDLVMADGEHGKEYLSEIAHYHVSGQLKVAPEHSDGRVLALMSKPAVDSLIRFRNLFNQLSRKFNKRQYLTYYLIAAHPGCNLQDMRALAQFTRKELHLAPEQVQIFTPLPSTWSTVMYYTGIDPFTGEYIFVERDMREKEKQKRALTG
ncbi:MAG TPA: YgiQ family radical SAM protein, partial [Spirochaetota bacterium]|nr:YgiQ family radical SAM protein [Spirochaetota bacterium]